MLGLKGRGRHPPHGESSAGCRISLAASEPRQRFDSHRRHDLPGYDEDASSQAVSDPLNLHVLSRQSRGEQWVARAGREQAPVDDPRIGPYGCAHQILLKGRRFRHGRDFGKRDEQDSSVCGVL